MTCPKCGSGELENISGDFETGVIAPDGYRERIYQEGYQCSKCRHFFDADEIEQLIDEGNDPELTWPA